MASVLFKREFVTCSSTEHQGFNDLNKIFEDKNIFCDSRDYYEQRPLFAFIRTCNQKDVFDNNLKNPLWSVYSVKITIVVEEVGEKVSFKFFTKQFERRVGKQWFKLVKNVDYITVNRKTGDIYTGFIYNYQNKRKFQKRVRRNFFSNDSLLNLSSKIKNIGNSIIPNSSEIANEASDVFINSITTTDNNLSRENKLFKFYLDKKGFKYPNNFHLYKSFHWTKEFRKILKKNDKKLVDSLLLLYGIRGKKIKKFLHECDRLNIQNYVNLSKLFGDEWLTQSKDAILKLLNYEPVLPDNLQQLKDHLSKEELRKVFKMVVNFVCNNEIDNWTFSDHVRMFLDLKSYGETDLKWKFDGSNYKSFSEEHLDWTDKLDHYRRGLYKREYPSYFYDVIEKKIDDYFPVILNESSDYNHESLTQSNCVKTYIGRPSSLIISLRKGEIDSLERITIEYRVVYLKNSESVYSDRVQTLGKYNQPVNETWNKILLKLDERVLSCHQDKNFKSVKIIKECANGTILKSDSHFDEYGYLKWSYNKVNDSNQFLW